MYLYTLEKTLPKNYTVDDIMVLNDLLTNAEEVHILLGKVFNTEKESNWRTKYSILYRQIESGKWLVSSNKKIDTEMTSKLSINILNETEVSSVKDSSEITINLSVSPFKPNKETNRREFIKSPEDRREWLVTKLTSNNECEIRNLIEKNKIMRYMAHNEKEKGCLMLTGYDYSITLKVKDKNAFIELMRKGIGPCKNYGFGMINVT